MRSLRRWASVGDANPQSSSPNSRHISSAKSVQPLASTCRGRGEREGKGGEGGGEGERREEGKGDDSKDEGEWHSHQ